MTSQTMTASYRVIARHHWLLDCTITESVSTCETYRKFTATIYGFRGFLIYEGELYEGITTLIIAKVKQIRGLIEQGDESVFHQDCRI
jgi:hypothetical protein